MTNLLVAVSLILTPSPIQAPQPSHPGGVGMSSSPVVDTALPDWIDTRLIFTFEKETLWPTVFSAASKSTTPDSLPPPTVPSPSLSVETPLPASSVSSDTPLSVTPPATVTPTLNPIDVGLNRLAELGATAWQLRTFSCLAWFESKNDPNAWSRTSDAGLFQVNLPLHRWRFGGRDPFDPVANAEVAFDIYRESGWRAWTTHNLCGV